MSFPTSPANNQVTLENGIAYTYNASRNAWYRTPTTALSAITSNTFTVLNSIIFADGTSQTTALNPIDAAVYAEFANIASSLAPKIISIDITSNTYSVLDDAAVNVGGGFIVVTGSNFQSGATVLIDTTPATSVSYINYTTLRAQVPAKSSASYNLYVVNPDGGTGIKPAGITYSSSPTWVTTSPLVNVLSNTVFSNTFSATGATSYANNTILPTGFNLLANGYYFGNISVGTATTYSFDIKATDDELQDSIKTFSLTTTLNPVLFMGGSAGIPAGTITSATSNIGDSRTADKAFDNSLGEVSQCYHSGTSPGTVIFSITFNQQRQINVYRILPRAGNDWKPNTWDLQGSNDNSTWTTVDSRSDQASSMPSPQNQSNLSVVLAAGKYAEWTVANPGSYSYYRFLFYNGSQSYLVIGEIMFYSY